jgi:hypothetical protein
MIAIELSVILLIVVASCTYTCLRSLGIGTITANNYSCCIAQGTKISTAHVMLRHHDNHHNDIQYNERKGIVCDTQLKCHSARWQCCYNGRLSRFTFCYAECRYAECHYAERRVAAVSCILNNKDSPVSIFGNLDEPQGQCLKPYFCV